MDFIADYVCYHDKYEIPRNYVYWSAIGLLAAVVHRKIHFQHGDIQISAGPLYVLMVGPMGNGKSTACDFARKMYMLVCPDAEIGSAIQSAEDIVKEMSKDTFARSFTNEKGQLIEVRPYAFFIEEFKDFIAYSPVRMLNFLGNIYSQNPYDAGTIKRGKERILNPCLNILACENPDQLQKFMKNDIFTGGLSRRFNLVYEKTYAEARTFIEIPEGSPERLAWARVKDRLIEVRKIVGSMQWTPSGRKFYEPWYVAKQKSLVSITNPLICGYESTKHIQLFKICMLLDACSDKPMFLLTDELLQLGLSFLDGIGKNMAKLTIAGGRSEVLGSQQKVLEILESKGGMFPEKQLKRLAEGEFKNPLELFSVFRYLEENEQIIKKRMKMTGDAVEREWYLTPKRFQDGIAKGDFVMKTSTSS